MKKQKMALFLFLIFAMVITACSKSSTPSNPASADASKAPAASAAASTGQKTEITIASDAEPVGFDPQTTTLAPSVRIYSLIYDTLTVMDKDINIKPGLADKWAFSADGKTLTFNLHPGVKWHNGREFTSEDVKYTFERIKDPKVGALLTSSFSVIEGIETPDKLTVVLKLKNPDTSLLYNISHWWANIVPKEITDLKTQTMGTGPYILDNVEPGQKYTLKKNPNYFKADSPKIDTITIRVMKDESERLAAIRSGKIDMTNVSTESAQLLQNTKGVAIVDYLQSGYVYLGLNVAKKPFDDVRVRQAISYAINRQDIVNGVFKGQGAVSGPIPAALKGYALDTKEFPSYQPNIEKAKQLLKEAGYEKGFDTVIETQALVPILVDSAQIVQQQLKQIGINVEIKKMEDAPFVERWRSKKMDMIVGRNPNGTDPDRNTRFYFHTQGSANVWNYANPKFDDLVQQALQATDENKRKDLYNQAQKMLVEESPNVFLASPKIFYAVSSRVKGFVPSPTGAAGEAEALRSVSISN